MTARLSLNFVEFKCSPLPNLGYLQALLSRFTHLMLEQSGSHVSKLQKTFVTMNAMYIV